MPNVTLTISPGIKLIARRYGARFNLYRSIEGQARRLYRGQAEDILPRLHAYGRMLHRLTKRST